MTQISPFSHFKNIILIGLFGFCANSLLVEILQTSFRSLKLFSFWTNYGHWLSFIIFILTAYVIFTWFPDYLFPKSFNKLRANNLILNYNFVLIFLGFLFQILIMAFAPGIFMLPKLFSGSLGIFDNNFYLILLTTKAVFDVLIVSVIWKTLDTKIQKKY